MKEFLVVLGIGLALVIVCLGQSVAQSTGVPKTTTEIHIVRHSEGSTPPPPQSGSSLIDVARRDALVAGISPDYFVRQINQESRFNPNALSPAGAEGIAQFMPSTASALGINPWNPYAALQAAAHLDASLLREFGSYEKMLAAYEAGPGAVQYAMNNCSNWRYCLPAETNNYINTILG